MNDFKSIGFTKKTYGIKGELKLKIEDNYLEDFAQAKVVFLNIEGQKIPFFIKAINFDNPFTIKFEEYESREAVIKLTGKEIFLQNIDIIAPENRTIEPTTLFYQKYVGYQLIDKELGKIGLIEEIIPYPQQEMATITYLGKTILIPLNEYLILKIDEIAKEILVELPEGMLDLE